MSSVKTVCITAPFLAIVAAVPVAYVSRWPSVSFWTMSNPFAEVEKNRADSALRQLHEAERKLVMMNNELRAETDENEFRAIEAQRDAFRLKQSNRVFRTNVDVDSTAVENFGLSMAGAPNQRV